MVAYSGNDLNAFPILSRSVPSLMPEDGGAKAHRALGESSPIKDSPGDAGGAPSASLLRQAATKGSAALRVFRHGHQPSPALSLLPPSPTSRIEFGLSSGRGFYPEPGRALVPKPRSREHFLLLSRAGGAAHVDPARKCWADGRPDTKQPHVRYATYWING